jgi:hypothetical protein
MCDCVSKILTIGKEGTRDAVVITYDEGSQSPSQDYCTQRASNNSFLQTLFTNRGTILSKSISMFSADGRRIGDRSIANLFTSLEGFSQYTDVIVDISALPRGLFFPMLSKLLALFDSVEHDSPYSNLHVVVSHSSAIDNQIVEEGIDELASFLYGFSAASFELEATSDSPRIWIPILGKNQRLQLERVYELVRPDEICPLLPSPARNPRTADDIVLEYRDLLFDQLRIESQNFIYASEYNPFEVYRQIMRSILHYQRALRPLGKCKIVVSALSSKLLSLGALLAAYELSQWNKGEKHIEVGVGHVDAQGYRFNEEDISHSKTECYTMWLFGECYDKSI